MNVKFLVGLKDKCAKIDAEYEARVAERNAEIAAVKKALSFLTSDDAHDLFTKTFNAAFLEKKSSNMLRRVASEALRKVAIENRNPRLAALAYQIRLDAFTKVKQAIDDMIAELVKEQADEVKHKDFCIKELNAQIGESKIQMKRAGEDREIENKDFQIIVADQRATIKLLTGAKNALSSYYGFVQAQGVKVSVSVTVEEAKPGSPQPAGFGEQKKNAMGGPVIALIDTTIGDAKKMMAEAIRDEEDAQTAYEDFVKDTNAEIDAWTKEIIDKSDAKAKAEKELAASEDALEGVVADLGHLSDLATELHSSCDFVLKNFEIRQKSRSEEIAALKQAKAILSGAKVSALLQSYVD